MITDDLIKKTIKKMGKRFDSHKVILELAHKNQRIYIEALNEISGTKPFHKLHSELGRRITQICRSLLYKEGKSRSKDLFGQNSKCITWLK